MQEPKPNVKKDASSLFKNIVVKKSVSIELSELSENKKVQSFMLEPTLKTTLTDHFKSKGLTWGVGLRTIIVEYMKREKLVK